MTKKASKTNPRAASAARKILAQKPEFDYARDLDNNIVDRSHKFCMVSESEWRAIRMVARALAPTF